MRWMRWTWIGFLVVAASMPASAAQHAVELRVATRLVPPLVVQEPGQLSGFSIDLWNALARKLQVTTKFLVSRDVQALLKSVQSKQADVGVAEISAKSVRAVAPARGTILANKWPLLPGAQQPPI